MDSGVERALTKGQQRRQEIICAAAEILREEGPSAVSHRKVAVRAGASLSATTYYFTGLDALLGEAAAYNISAWRSRADAVAQWVESQPPPQSVDQAVEAVLRACLPKDVNLENHYLQLVAATAYPTVNRAYREGRSHLNEAVAVVLDWMKSPVTAELIMSIVDGAAVAALSEGLDVRETARRLVRSVLGSIGPIFTD